ncbi:bacterioferritin [Neisseria sp. 23W00296]|uniref:bacterioferritin n=1 Tax=unclassified Neisseria TaxID=2623750 RepID=UPI0002A38443|nr:MULTISPECIES: bacterioferritin [unclassified Neisseria]ASP17856.1 bacterioferritin [Neisseria sp. KEM232]EKY04466.1 bacterioferritin [Neisseria sp. oral taxon 020 str. F0370]
MQGERTVIRELNKNLGLLLVTINQYFLHARILKNWGLEELSEHFYKQSIREMKSADDLIERILLLEGLPNLQELGKLLIGENTEEIIKCDLAKENEKHAALSAAIAVCEEHQDYVSRALLEKHKNINEEHIDWLETQQELIAKTGLANYLQLGAQED